MLVGILRRPPVAEQRATIERAGVNDRLGTCSNCALILLPSRAKYGSPCYPFSELVKVTKATSMKLRYSAAFFYFIVYTSIATSNGNEPVDSASMQTLFNTVFKDYNKYMRPVKDNSNATVVNLTPWLYSLVDVNERIGTLKFIQCLRLTWMDELITWDPTRFNNTTYIKVPANLVWTPDVAIYNALQLDLVIPTEDLKVRINHLGRARLSFYQVVTQRCHDFNLEMFPFDDQSCVTRYASWHYSAEEMKVIPVHIEFAAQHLEKHSSWRIIEYSPGEYRETYAAEEGDDSLTYEEIHYRITIRRDAKYYVETVVAPTFIITTICLTGLFVPFSSTGERQQKVTLGLTTLLTIAVVLHMVTEEMPKSPEGTTMLGKYIIEQMALCGFAILVTVLVMFAHRWVVGQKYKVPHWLLTIVLYKTVSQRKFPGYHSVDSAGCLNGHVTIETFETENGLDKNASTVMNGDARRVWDAVMECRKNLELIRNSLTEDRVTEDEGQAWTRVYNTFDLFALIFFLLMNCVHLYYRIFAHYLYRA